MNLYFAYMNVNYVDILGDNVFLEMAKRNLNPLRYYHFNIGFASAAVDAVVDIGTMSYDFLGETFTYFFINTSEERLDKFNKARKSISHIANHREEMMQAIMQEITDFSAKYAEAMTEGKNIEWAWEMEGRIAFEVLSMFIGVGEVSAVAKASKGAKYANALRLAIKAKMTKAFKGTKNSKFMNTVDDFLSAGKGCVTSFNKCFVAGTQVVTDKGLKNIEEIQVGDFVMSKDPKTKKSDYKPVLQVFKVQHTELFVLTYHDANGDAYELKVSGEHPFWVSDKGWIAARELAIADRLLITDETVVTITSISKEEAPKGETLTTYNFEVDEYHTYFVLQEGKTNGFFAVWVHNTGKPCPDIGDIIATRHGGIKIGDKRYKFKTKKRAKMAASEIAGDLGPYDIVRLPEYDDFLLGKHAKKSKRKIGKHSQQLKSGKPLRGFHDHHVGHSTYDDLRPHINAWSERTGSTYKHNFHLYYGE